MCARFTAGKTAEDIGALFGILNLPEYTPRYNVAPSQQVPVLRLNSKEEQELVPLRWGLIPKWAKADMPQAQAGLVNAKSETVLEKPAFRDAISQRRGLVAADGFIEWETLGGKKQPHWFRLLDSQPFAFAAIWEPACPAGKFPEDETFAILTTSANDDVSPFHDRMPVILLKQQFKTWLDPKTPLVEIQAMLKPMPTGQIISHPISRVINKPTEDRKELLERVVTGLFG
jgi:putative SOS response-associated peptidase YedK